MPLLDLAGVRLVAMGEIGPGPATIVGMPPGESSPPSSPGTGSTARSRGQQRRSHRCEPTRAPRAAGGRPRDSSGASWAGEWPSATSVGFPARGARQRLPRAPIVPVGRTGAALVPRPAGDQGVLVRDSRWLAPPPDQPPGRARVHRGERVACSATPSPLGSANRASSPGSPGRAARAHRVRGLPRPLDAGGLRAPITSGLNYPAGGTCARAGRLRVDAAVEASQVPRADSPCRPRKATQGPDRAPAPEPARAATATAPPRHDARVTFAEVPLLLDVTDAEITGHQREHAPRGRAPRLGAERAMPVCSECWGDGGRGRR